MTPPVETAASIWTIFAFSFMVALTGALAPGPLLTYTIAKTAATPRRGYWIGAWVIVGHALLESVIIIGLLGGLATLLTNTSVIRGIGMVGGLLLVAFGANIIRDAVTRPVVVDLTASDTDETGSTGWTRNPILGGALVSMANPYWWIWWSTIGLAFMTQFQIHFGRWPQLTAFFVGHEAGDLAWYLVVSVMVHFGGRRLHPKIFAGILVVCGIFMVGFGIYLGVSPFMKAPQVEMAAA